jgi:hypothetical protein
MTLMEELHHERMDSSVVKCPGLVEARSSANNDWLPITWPSRAALAVGPTNSDFQSAT